MKKNFIKLSIILCSFTLLTNCKKEEVIEEVTTPVPAPESVMAKQLDAVYNGDGYWRHGNQGQTFATLTIVKSSDGSENITISAYVNSTGVSLFTPITIPVNRETNEKIYGAETSPGVYQFIYTKAEKRFNFAYNYPNSSNNERVTFNGTN